MKNIYLSLLLICITCLSYGQIPLLNSNVNAVHRVIYLDFDGQMVTGTAWNSAFNTPTINAAASGLNAAVITEIWRRVSEDYRPFNVNVTTDLAKFNAATPTSRMRIVFTPTSSWYPNTVGGVAYLNSFAWGGNPDTPCWVFNNALSNSAKNCAEAASHEAGHTLSLRHQSIWSATCTKTAEYHGGIGTGMTSWAPIMGVGYSRNVTIWHNGPNSTTCTAFQFDHGNNGITNSSFLSYRSDDVGNNVNTGKQLALNSALVLDTGIISTNTDIDVYKFSTCSTRYITIDVKPWALDTTNYNGANLDVRLSLINAATNATIAVDTPLVRLNARIGATLPAGSYYFLVDGGGSSNYSDYGSMGQYHIRITSNNVPAITSDFNVAAPFCTGQPIAFTDNSSGSPANWQWTLSGATPASSTLQNVSAVYNTAGIYTVQLSATNGTLSTCAVSKTIQVSASPALTVTANPSAICSGNTSTIVAAGATSYIWNTSSTSSSIQVTPFTTMVYTVTGSNNNCNNTRTVQVTVNPLPVINVNASPTLICQGESATLSAGGASTYSWSNGANSGTISVNPTVTTVYTVLGTDANGCAGSAALQLTVSWCTDIKESTELNNIVKLYPNPTTGKIIILNESINTLKINITDIRGKLILSETLGSGKQEINISEKTEGVYFFKILKDNQEIGNGKLIKH